MADKASWQDGFSPLQRFALRSVYWIYSRYTDLAFRSSRWELIGFEPYMQMIDAGKPFLIINWHGQLAMMPYAWDWKRHNLTVLTTDRPVARIMADAIRRQGVHTVPMNLGGRRDPALLQVVRAARAGHCIGIAPDGPKGPAGVVKPGVVELAGLLGLPIAPIAVSVRRGIRAKSWDSFLLPALWTKGVFVMAPPIAPPVNPDAAAVADWQVRIGAALDGATAQAAARAQR